MRTEFETPLPDGPLGEVLDNEFFYAEGILDGDPQELAETTALKLRSHNLLDPEYRSVYLAPTLWLPTEEGVQLALVGEIDYHTKELKETWRDTENSFRGHQAEATTYSVAAFLESHLGIKLHVRPLYTSNLEDCALIDAMRQQRGGRWRSNSRYPSVDDLVSAGHQETSLIGNQGDYACNSPYFSAVLRTKEPQDELNTKGLSAACRFLFKRGAVALCPQVAFQLEDGRFELRVAGCAYEHIYDNERPVSSGYIKGRIIGRVPERSDTLYGRKIAATSAVADPISHYLNVEVVAVSTYKTTADNLDDIIAAEKLGDEVEALGLPEPEDFIVRPREEVLADDERQRSGEVSTLGEPELTGEEELEQLIGLDEVKRQIREFVAYAKVCKMRGTSMPHLHMRFDGNPGTGKTTVARIVGHMLYDAGVIPKRNVFVETSGNHFSLLDVRAARRGVLFIDEAYTLGFHTLADLVKAMEDCHRNYERDGFIVVLAGYPHEMEQMVSRNPGLRDRIGITLDFADYSAQELIAIFDQQLKRAGLALEPEAKALIDEKLTMMELMKDGNFSNGRIIRKVFERVQMRQASLFGDNPCIQRETITDVFADEFADLVGDRRRGEQRHTAEDELSGDEQLDRLIGLEETKRQIREFLDYAAVQKERGGTMPSLHMRFDGNPGTGKTTLARIVGRMMYDRGLLPRRDGFVECDRESLVSVYLGNTAPKTKRKIQQARHGVLFIDEAYALDGGSSIDYGTEALSTIVKAMEDCREHFERDGFVCIMAGYPDLMEKMVSLNPGLRDRFGLTVNFADYTAEELLNVFELYAHDEGYKLAKAARTLLTDQLEQVVAAKDDDFANARLVRKIFERTKMRQAVFHGSNSCFKADVIASVFEDEDLSGLLGKSQALACNF